MVSATFHAGAHQLDELQWGHRLDAEYDVQPIVLGLGFSHPAKNDHWKPGILLPQLPYKFRSIAPWHDVVCDDQADTLAQSPQRGQRSLCPSRQTNRETGIAQHRLTHPQLQRIVVDQ